MNYIQNVFQDSRGEYSSKRFLAAAIIGFSLVMILLESLNILSVSNSAYDLLKVLGGASLASVASEWFAPRSHGEWGDV